MVIIYFKYLIQNHDELFCYLTEDIIFIFSTQNERTIGNFMQIVFGRVSTLHLAKMRFKFNSNCNSKSNSKSNSNSNSSPTRRCIPPEISRYIYQSFFALNALLFIYLKNFHSIFEKRLKLTIFYAYICLVQLLHSCILLYCHFPRFPRKGVHIS